MKNATREEETKTPNKINSDLLRQVNSPSQGPASTAAQRAAEDAPRAGSHDSREEETPTWFSGWNDVEIISFQKINFFCNEN